MQPGDLVGDSDSGVPGIQVGLHQDSTGTGAESLERTHCRGKNLEDQQPFMVRQRRPSDSLCTGKSKGVSFTGFTKYLNPAAPGYLILFHDDCTRNIK